MEVIKQYGEKKKYRIGYTQGVFDLFHSGHLNLLLNAKAQCNYLIVGINADDLVEEYKNKRPVINEIERSRIMENLKMVDEVLIVSTLDKKLLWDELHFEAIFIGDDWKGNARWEKTELDLSEVGVDVVYLPYTENISSTYLGTKEKDCVKDRCEDDKSN